MSRIKYIGHAIVALCVALSAFFSIRSVRADSAPVQVSTQPEIYVMGVTTDKSSYAVGDTIKGTIDIYNGASLSVGSLYYTLLIGGKFDKAGNPGVVFDEKKGDTLSIGPDQHKIVPFTYVIPGNVTGSDVEIHAQTYLPSGLMLGGWESPEFAVTGGKPMLTYHGAYLQLSQADGTLFSKKFPTLAGAPIDKAIHPDATISVAMLNQTGEDVSLVPAVSIYDRTIESGDQVFAKALDPITVTSAHRKDPYSLDFTVPTLDYKPGTYEGKMEFKDTEGVTRSPTIYFRYVIKGPMAIIHSAVSGARSVVAGQAFSLALSVTGEPLDMFFDSPKPSNDVTAQVVVSDDKGSLIASSSQDAVIGPDMSTIVFPLDASADAGSLRISAKIVDKASGAVLATYDEQLSAPADASSAPFFGSHGTLVLGLIIIAFLAVLGLVIYFKVSRPAMLLLFALLAGFGASIARAQSAGNLIIISSDYDYADTAKHTSASNETAVFDAPVVNQKYSAGTALLIRGHTAYTGCLNSSYDNEVTFASGVAGQSATQDVSTSADAYGNTYADNTTDRYTNYAQSFVLPVSSSGSQTATMNYIRDQEIFSTGPAKEIISSLLQSQPYSIIGGSIVNVVPFEDLNGNGVMDAGEPAINEAAGACGTMSTTTWSYPGSASLTFAGVTSSMGVTGSATVSTSTMNTCQMVVLSSGSSSAAMPVASYAITPLSTTRLTVGISTSSLPVDSHGDTLWVRTTPDFAISTTSVPTLMAGGQTYTYYFGISPQPTPYVAGACNLTTEASSGMPLTSSSSQSVLCSAGTPKGFYSYGGTYIWNCNGTGSPVSGTNALQCYEYICQKNSVNSYYCPNSNSCLSSYALCNVAGQCNTAYSGYYSTVAPSSALCSYGSSTPVIDNGQNFSWTCQGINGSNSSQSCQISKCASGQTFCSTGLDAGTCAATCRPFPIPPAQPVVPVASTTLMSSFTVNPDVVRATTTPCSSQWQMTTNDGSSIACSLDGVLVSSSTATTRSLNFNVGIHTVSCVADGAIQSTTTKCSLIPHYSNE